MKIAAIVLAAGSSDRMSPGNKLLLPVQGKPIIIKSLDNVIQAGYAPVVVVLGCEMESVREVLVGRRVDVAANPDWEKGLSSSIKVGIRSLPENLAGALLMLADMPLVQVATLINLKKRFLAGDGTKIVFPTYGKRQGNPVLFPARLFPELLELEGERGAKSLLRKYAADAVPVPVQSDEVLMDCDTPEDYRRILSRIEQQPLQ
ncbi:MAG: NTP transferase domain-containing protein [Candidatus Neomarinimicrobiota bacterium]